LADNCAGNNVAEVPDLGPLADDYGVIDVGGFVYEKLAHAIERELGYDYFVKPL
jgi:hypothetical protein